MPYRSTVQRLAGGFLVSMMLLANCQRASYSFQGSLSTSLPAEASVSADTAAPTATPNNAIAAANGRQNRWTAPLPHTGRARHWVRPAVLRSATVAAVPRSKVRPQPLLARRPPERPTSSHGRPTDPKPYHKGVAFALAVGLGFFGAHLFYLEHNRDGFRYLAYTLFGLLLLAIAIPVGMSSLFGAGFGGVVVAIYLLVGGFVCIAATYLHALFDAIRILTGALAP